MTIICSYITAFAKDLKLNQKLATLSSMCYYKQFVRLENYNTNNYIMPCKLESMKFHSCAEGPAWRLTALLKFPVNPLSRTSIRSYTGLRRWIGPTLVLQYRSKVYSHESIKRSKAKINKNLTFKFEQTIRLQRLKKTSNIGRFLLTTQCSFCSQNTGVCNPTNCPTLERRYLVDFFSICNTWSFC